MNYDKHDTICISLLICNELSCIDQGSQLLITTNTMNIITILQPLNFNVFFCTVTFYSGGAKHFILVYGYLNEITSGKNYYASSQAINK